MNLVKRCVSALVAGGFVFGVLYVGARFDVPWIAGFLLLAIAYLAGIEYNPAIQGTSNRAPT